MDVPTVPECYKLLNEVGAVTQNIIKHSEQVTKVAVYIAKKLIAKGEKIDLDLLKASCLLHDIAKSVDFKNYEPNPLFGQVEFTEKQIQIWKLLKEKYPDKSHEEVAKSLLQDYPEVGKIISSHGYLKILEGFDNWEEKLLFYSDQLVMHTQIVTLKERLEDGHKRYLRDKPLSKEVIKVDKKIFELQEEILNKSGIISEDIISLNNVDIEEVLKI